MLRYAPASVSPYKYLYEAVWLTAIRQEQKSCRFGNVDKIQSPNVYMKKKIRVATCCSFLLTAMFISNILDVLKILTPLSRSGFPIADGSLELHS